LQHINDLATSKLEASAVEIKRLNRDNDGFRTNIKQSDNDMLFLKLQLKELELLADPTKSTEARRKFALGLENWKYEWKTAQARRQLPSNRMDGEASSLAGYNDGWEEGSSTSNSVTSSNIARRKLIISRDPDRHVSHPNHHHHSQDRFFPASGNGPPVSPEYNADLRYAEPEDDVPAEILTVRKNVKKEKTPLQELWDGLAEFAGIRDPNEDDDDEEEES
jgi:hypothetical protein